MIETFAMGRGVKNGFSRCVVTATVISFPVSVNGSHSTWDNITMGDLRGSVLGPKLFFFDINDMKYKIQSNMRLYADDAIVRKKINSLDDHKDLQQDLDTLFE